MGNQNSILPSILTETPKEVVEDTSLTPLQEALKLVEKKDFVNAKLGFEAAINAGEPQAHVELATLYLLGNGLEKNPDLAVEHLVQAVEKGVGSAHNLLGLIYYRGLGGLPIDLSAAVSSFREGIEMGNHDCKAHFAWMTLQGQGVPEKDLIKGMTALKEAESAGSLDALCYLGFIAMEGVGPETMPNYQLALQNFTKASDKGHLESKVNLAHMHYFGKGTPKSVWDAAKLYTQAAERGHSLAQCHIGMMYRDGVGVKVNPQLAKSWFEKSAAQGDALGCYCLAKLTLDDPTSDWLDVVDLFSKAAEHSNVRGEFNEGIYVDSLARVFDGY